MKVRNVDAGRFAERLDKVTAARRRRKSGFEVRRINLLIAEAEVPEEDIAVVLKVTKSAVTNKIAGRRAWHVHEVERLLMLLSRRLGRRVTFEEAFGELRGGKTGAQGGAADGR